MSEKDRGKSTRGGSSTRGKSDRGGSSAQGYRGGRGGQSSRSDRPQYVPKDQASGTAKSRGRDEETKDSNSQAASSQVQPDQQRYSSRSREASKGRKHGAASSATNNTKQGQKYVAKKKAQDTKFTQSELLSFYVEEPQKNELFEEKFIAQKAALDIISFESIKPQVHQEFNLQRGDCIVYTYQKRHPRKEAYRKFSDEDPDWIGQNNEAIMDTNFDFGKKTLVRGDSNTAGGSSSFSRNPIEDEDERQNKLFEELIAAQRERDQIASHKEIKQNENMNANDLMNMFSGMSGTVGQSAQTSNAIDVDKLEQQQQKDFSKIDEQFEEKMKGKIAPKKTTLIGIEEESDDEEDMDWDMPDETDGADEVGWGLKKQQDKEVLKHIEKSQKKSEKAKKSSKPQQKEQKVSEEPKLMKGPPIDDPAIMTATHHSSQTQPSLPPDPAILTQDPAIMTADPAIIQAADPAIMSNDPAIIMKTDPAIVNAKQAQPKQVQIKEEEKKDEQKDDNYSINPFSGSLQASAKSFVPKQRKPSAANPNQIPEATLSAFSMQNYKRTQREKINEGPLDALFAQEMPGFQTVWNNETFNSVLTGSEDLNVQLDPLQQFLVTQNPFSSILMRKSERRMWFWRGSYGGGPFTTTQMYTWYKEGYLRPNSIIRLGDSIFFKIKDLIDFANGRRVAPQRVQQMQMQAPQRPQQQNQFQDQQIPQQQNPEQTANQRLDSIFEESNGDMPPQQQMGNMPPGNPNIRGQMQMPGGMQAQGNPWAGQMNMGGGFNGAPPGGQMGGAPFGGGAFGGFMTQSPMGGGAAGGGPPQQQMMHGFGGQGDGGQQMRMPPQGPNSQAMPLGAGGPPMGDMDPAQMAQLQNMVMMAANQGQQPGQAPDMGQMESALRNMLGFQGGQQ